MTDPRDPAASPPGDAASDPRDPETADVDEGAAPPGGPRIVGDRYRLGPLIGRGGMATIHRATGT
ncbi:MAG: hypothetical protein OEX05_11490, partial [Chloroflexota bacterium]|nr:hypothetical protein [Chloroflexota bacterium]